jgi:hypothetical protein
MIMNVPEDELSSDQVWENVLALDATASVPDEGEIDATPTEETTPETDPNEAAFNAFLPRVVQHFEQNVLPQYRDQWLREAQNRARQSQDERQKRIEQRLQPLFDTLQRLQTDGYLSPEDAQKQLAAAHQQVSQQEDAQAKAQSDWEQRQAWLASTNAQTQAAQPAWAGQWEQAINGVLQQSKLEEGDPELELIPTTLTDPDPTRALALMRESVATAEKMKEQRIASERPRRPKPFVDMGTGASGGNGNPLAGIEDVGDLWNLAQGG